MLELVGFPIVSWKENEVVHAVSSFGLFLGLVERRSPADFSYWMVAITTDNLERIHDNLAVIIGGFKHTVAVKPIKVVYGLIYREDLLHRKP